MTDPLEPALRDVFNECAAQIEPAAATRLLAVNYRPRRHRLPRAPAFATAGVAGAAAAAAAVLSLTSGAAPAFAGWTPVPTSPAPGQTASVAAQCGSRTPILTDTRGPYTAAVYAIPNGIGTCLLQGQSVESVGTAGGGDNSSVPPSAIQMFPSADRDTTGHAFSVLDGRVGKDVAGVAFTLDNGMSVTASVSGGWYLAWWPGFEHAQKVAITTRTGTHTTALPASATLGSCGRGSLACGATGYAPAPESH